METILELKNLNKIFYSKNSEIHAVNDVSLSLCRGETLGLVGESGCGKSTITKLITGLHSVTEGKILLDNQDMVSLSKKDRKKVLSKVQMIFQDPLSSFDPRIPVGKNIAEVIRHRGLSKTKEESKQKVISLLKRVGLDETYYHALPIHVSGGECQRIAIARALATEPELLICDEATSALDVSVQAQIINLLDEIRKERNLSLLFISHDLSLVSSFCSRVAVMYRGKIVEMASSRELLAYPHHPYTKLLLSSVFPMSNNTEWALPTISDGENPSDHGCVFCHRCKEQHPCACKESIPELREISKDHFCACKI